MYKFIIKTKVEIFAGFTWRMQSDPRALQSPSAVFYQPGGGDQATTDSWSEQYGYDDVCNCHKGFYKLLFLVTQYNIRNVYLLRIFLFADGPKNQLI